MSALRFSKQKQKGIKNSGWREYDGDSYGFYRLQDDTNHINLAVMIIRQRSDVVFRVEGDSVRGDGYSTSLNLLMYIYPNELSGSFSMSSTDAIVRHGLSNDYSISQETGFCWRAKAASIVF